jgi:hypothetical protein
MKTILALIAIALLPALPAHAETPRLVTCDGVLNKSTGGLIEEGEFCQLDREAIIAVSRVCGKNPCEVIGYVIDCPVNCVKMTKITSIRLAKP